MGTKLRLKPPSDHDRRSMCESSLLARWTLLLLMTAGLLPGPLAPPAAAQVKGDVAVVVHPDVAVDNLTVNELRRVVLGDREFWPAGVRITLLIRAPVAHERDVVLKTLCQMTEAQFRQHWIAKVFRADTALAPKIVYSAEMAVAMVNRFPGAITFVDAALVGKGLKVVKVDGRAPGEPGYRLR
jgi:phosphate transport system substrate-binding protein